jgi:xanthine dehydrogenase molybdopterin-binding subunit B
VRVVPELLQDGCMQVLSSSFNQPEIEVDAHCSMLRLCMNQIQVRLVTTRQEDFRMFGGRAEKTMEYSVGWDDEGRITAVDMAVTCVGE